MNHHHLIVRTIKIFNWHNIMEIWEPFCRSQGWWHWLCPGSWQLFQCIYKYTWSVNMIKIVSIVLIRHFACIASHISNKAYTVWLGWASLMFTLGLSFMYSTTHFLPGSKLFCIKSLRYMSLMCKVQPTIQFKSAWLVCCHLQQKMHILYEETLVIVWH